MEELSCATTPKSCATTLKSCAEDEKTILILENHVNHHRIGLGAIHMKSISLHIKII